MSTKRNALGKGLAALLEDAGTDITSRAGLSAPPAIAGSVANILLNQIETNPFQPRSTFEEDALLELAASLREQGIIQPITVRKLGYDKYQIISGERRFRAAMIAGLENIPAYIRIANDQAMLEMALVENIQRENLNAIEIAISYQRLIEECSLTQEELSKKVGKNRSTVTNYLRLLKLPPEIQAGIRDNKLSMSHARSIIGIENPAEQLALYRKIILDALSVRDVEELARSSSSRSRQGKELQAGKTASVKEAEDRINKALGAEAEIVQKAGGQGKIVIRYSSPAELARILSTLDR